MTTPQKEIRLFNPIPCADGERSRMGGAWIAKSEYDYLIHGVLSGVYGAQSAILGIIINKLNTKLRELGIPDHYNPDNEGIVARLLDNICFDERPAPVAKDTGGVDGPANRKPRRSSGPRAKRGPTPSIRRRKSDKTDKRADVKGGAEDGKRRDRTEGTTKEVSGGESEVAVG